MDFHSKKLDDDTYDIDVDSWTSFDGDDEDYCYGCEDWTDNDGHGNCKACGIAFDKIEGDSWATAHTTKTSVATAPTISTTGDIYGRSSGFTWGSGGTSWWNTGGVSSLSSMWGGTSTFNSGKTEAYRLMKHKNHLDSLCKVVDPNIKHNLTFSSHSSGHTNMRTGQIVIDGDLLKESDDNLDITAGLAIHEKLHLIYSKELMVAESGMRERLTTTQGQSMLLHDIVNIIEDEYIEKQLSTTARGFVHYIEKCKKHYFEDSFGSMGHTKDPFADLINTFMLFVRYPSLIDEDRRKRHAPHIRFFARTMADALDSRDDTYVAMETIYSYLLKSFDKMNEGADDKRLEDAMDKADARTEDLMKSFEESGVSISEDEWSAIREKLVKEFAEDARREHRDDLADSMATADEIVGKLTGEDKNDESKFLDDTLIKEMKDLEESDYSEYDMDKSLAISSRQTKITWQKAKSDSYHVDRYKDAKSRVKKQISKLKKKITLYGNSEKYTIRNQKRGKIDKRMLHRIPSGRMDLFKTTITKEDKPLDICLLVDESGSMGSYTMRHARDAAISIKEALADNDMLNLWVFGHSADEDARGNTDMIEYWSPSMQDRPMAMGGMRARYENRDGNAIVASAERVRSETDQPQGKKLMIVLSDGAPSADNYRGEPAESHTRKCVKNIESKGWDVIQVGFAGSRKYSMEKMFSNWIYVDDTDKIGDKVSKIIRKVIKI